MIFKVLIKSELDDLYEMPGITVRIGKANPKNPDMELWRPLVLRPGEAFLWATENEKHEYAPYEKIILKQAFSKIPFEGDSKNKLRECVETHVVKRKDWDKKFCPFRDHKYTCLFVNKTETVWSFFGEYIGRIEVRPGIPKRIPLSVLNIHLTPWKEIEIRYHKRVDNSTGKIFPRTAKWFGTTKRSDKELKELEADYDNALKKYRLTPDEIRPEFAIDVDLMKEKGA